MSRRWFQLHLSTMIVLSFVAAPLFWANITINTTKDTNNRLAGREAHYGWPIYYYSRYENGFISKLELLPWDVDPEFECAPLLAVPIDFTVAVAILGAAAVACEMLARRKAQP